MPREAAKEWIFKAQRACDSAATLLATGDVDGACNRAYYAMFDAARAALLASEAPVPSDVARTHSGLITAFGLYLVKEGPLSRDLGRMLKRAEETRIVADYAADSVDLSDARDLVAQAQAFVLAIHQQYFAS